ncbi:ankyrin repeat-containing domain protein, partial [Phaeosphaeriaceae sp. PMI808]
MNNFAGADYANFDGLFEQVKWFDASQMNDILDALPNPYSQALQQSILTISIKSNAVRIVKILIQRGLEVGHVTCLYGGETYTPLGLACRFRRLEIVEVLIDTGINFDEEETNSGRRVDAVDGLFSHHYQSPASHESSVAQILRLLLQAGAQVPVYRLMEREFWKDQNIVQVYIQHATKPINLSGIAKYESPNIFVILQDHCNMEDTTAAIQKMLGCYRVSPSVEQSHALDLLMAAFEKASYIGNESLVNYFMSIGLKPNGLCLCEAIRGNNTQIIEEYVKGGVDVFKMCHPKNLRYFEKPLAYVGVLPSEIDPFLLEGVLISYPARLPFIELIRLDRQDILRTFEGTFNLGKIAREVVEIGLMAAAEAGNTGMVKRMLQNLPNVKGKHSFDMSHAITVAVLGNHDDIIEMLMAAGIRPNDSSVAAAILVRRERLVQLFLDVVHMSTKRPLLLFFAVRWGNKKIIHQIIQSGFSNIRWGSYLGLDPLVLKFPLVNVADPLVEAIKLGKDEIIKILLDNGAKINQDRRDHDSSPLSAAIDTGQEHLVHTLLAQGADPNDPAAFSAAVRHSVTMTKVVLDAFCHQNRQGRYRLRPEILEQAVDSENLEITRMLVKYTDVNCLENPRDNAFHPEANMLGRRERHFGGAFFWSMLGNAIQTRNISLISMILDGGCDKNRIVVIDNIDGSRPALAQAIHTGDLNIVKLLRQAGAEINYPAALGVIRTSLQLAVELGHNDIVDFLLDEGADVNAPPYPWGGATALQMAAIKGSMGTAELLLSRNAEINAPGSRYEGRTAFEGAAEHGRMDMLLWLYHQGVDIVSDGGEQVKRAMKFAEQAGQLAARDLVKILAES